MLAAGAADVENVVRLLRAGADINKIDVNGWSAILYATAAGALPVVQVLLDHRTPAHRHQKAHNGTCLYVYW